MKMLASDYDGTLFFRKPYSEEDIEAIEKFRKAGNAFVINTGRGYKQIVEHYPYEGKTILPDLLVCNSGAVIADPERNVIKEYVIDPEIPTRLHELYPDKPLSFSADGEFVLLDHPYFHKRFADVKHVRIVDSLDELKGASFHSAGLHFDSVNEALDFAEKLEEQNLKIGVHVNIDNIDLNAEGHDKATGMLEAAKILGADQSYAIGDSFNDLPALLQAEQGFLMRNSNEKLIKIALDNGIQIVDSVAEAIEAIMKEEDQSDSTGNQ